MTETKLDTKLHLTVSVTCISVVVCGLKAAMDVVMFKYESTYGKASIYFLFLNLKDRNQKKRLRIRIRIANSNDIQPYTVYEQRTFKTDMKIWATRDA